MSRRGHLTFAALVVAAAATAFGAGEIATVHVGIVLEASASFSQRRLRTMTEEAAAIWRPYGVAISRLTPLEGLEDVRVVVRIPLSPPPGHQATGAPKRPLGSVLFVDGIPDGVITIRPETVETVILAAGWNGRSLTEAPLAVRDDLAGRALGRVLAHELGHYLLAQKGHASTGLMRASFRGSELVDINRRAFRLPSRDRAALGMRLAQLVAVSTGSPGPRP